MITVLGFKNGALKFLKDGFGHVDIFRLVESKWIYIRMTFNFITTNIVEEINIKKYSKMLIIKSTHQYKKRFGLYPFSCVKLAAYIIGIHPWVFTPYGLYKTLKMGGYSNITYMEEI